MNSITSKQNDRGVESWLCDSFIRFSCTTPTLTFRRNVTIAGRQDDFGVDVPVIPVDYAGMDCLSLATPTFQESILHCDCLANTFCHFAIRGYALVGLLRGQRERGQPVPANGSRTGKVGQDRFDASGLRSRCSKQDH